MSIPAPQARLVDALSGEIASPILGMLATADHISDGLAGAEQLRAENAELRTRLQELEADRDGYRESALDLSTVLQSAFADIATVKAERDELAERLDSLRNAHQITLAALADARRGLTEPWHGVASGGQS